MKGLIIDTPANVFQTTPKTPQKETEAPRMKSNKNRLLIESP
jgi:hypothetical protein